MKLSFSRSIVAEGQTPMGIKTSRCLRGGAAGSGMSPAQEGGPTRTLAQAKLATTLHLSTKHLERSTLNVTLVVPSQVLGKGFVPDYVVPVQEEQP